MTSLVFIHYFGGNALSWQWLRRYMPEDLDCHFLSLPGFGDSKPLAAPHVDAMAQFVLDYCDEKNLDNIILVGHSMGGKIALRTVQMNTGQRIEKVVLVAPSPPTIETMETAEKQRMLNHPDAAEAHTTAKNGLYDPAAFEPLQFLVQTQLIIDHNTWRWWIEKGMSTPLPGSLDFAGTALYLVYSTDDKAITPSMIQQEVLRTLNFEKIYKKEGVGHLIPQEQPQQLAQILGEIITD